MELLQVRQFAVRQGSKGFSPKHRVSAELYGTTLIFSIQEFTAKVGDPNFPFGKKHDKY